MTRLQSLPARVNPVDQGILPHSNKEEGVAEPLHCLLNVRNGAEGDLSEAKNDQLLRMLVRERARAGKDCQGSREGEGTCW